MSKNLEDFNKGLNEGLRDFQTCENLGNFMMEFICSECRYSIFDAYSKNFKYCPNCGRRICNSERESYDE
jgi:DNA-directed RNA polymerase subunit RPC12/RpoP